MNIRGERAFILPTVCVIFQDKNGPGSGGGGMELQSFLFIAPPYMSPSLYVKKASDQTRPGGGGDGCD